MRRKLGLCFMVMAAVLTSVLPTEAKTQVITFEGEAEKFIKSGEGNFGDGFINMEPGERKEQVITLTNNSYNEMKFYLSGEVTDNIADKGNKEAIYDIDLVKDGNKFFHGIIGSKDSVGEKFLGQNFLLASLKKGETTSVKMGITLDGDSAGMDYQNKQGEVKLNIKVETQENGVTTSIQVAEKVKGSTSSPLQMIKTGDRLPIVLMAAAFISLGVIVVVLVKKKQKKEE